MYAVAQRREIAQRQIISQLFKTLLTKLSFIKHFLQRWRMIDFNKHRDKTTKRSAPMYVVAPRREIAQRQKKSQLFKTLLTKLSFIKHFLQCWRMTDFNKHRDKTTKFHEGKPFRDVLDPKLYTKEYLEEQLVDLGIAGFGEQLFDILIKAFHSRCSPSLGIAHVRGMLLYGPTGCGKTVLARHFSKFLPAKESLLVDAMVIGAKNGEHIRRARSFLKNAIADEKKYGAKSDMYVVVLDGMISAFQRKNRVQSWNDDSEELLEQLLRLMDGPDALNNIFVIATTDRIDLVEEWVMRRGRFDLLVEIDYPTEKQRFQILDMLIRDLRDDYLLDGDVNIQELATLTRGCASSSMPELISRAYSCAFRRNRHSDFDLRYTMEDFIMAIKEIRCRDKLVMDAVL